MLSHFRPRLDPNCKRWHRSTPPELVFGTTGVVFGTTLLVFGSAGTVFWRTGTVFGRTGTVFGRTGTVFGRTGTVFGTAWTVFGRTAWLAFGTTGVVLGTPGLAVLLGPAGGTATCFSGGGGKGIVDLGATGGTAAGFSTAALGGGEMCKAPAFLTGVGTLAVDVLWGEPAMNFWCQISHVGIWQTSSKDQSSRPVSTICSWANLGNMGSCLIASIML